MRDYYDVLGVSKSATADEVKRAYRQLSKKHHPDRNPDDASAEGKFKEVQGAYEVLKDPEKRAQYDRFGPAAVGNWHTDQSGQKVYAWSEGGPEISFDDLGDLFSAFRGYGDSGSQEANPFADLFGRGGRARRPVAQRGQDLERSVNLSFEQAAKGTTVEIDIIGGHGQRQTLDVKIPAGVKPGQRIRLKGKGQPGSSGGPPGDLYLAVTVRAHRLFRRQGKDVLIDLPLTIVEASLGATVDIPTLDGTVSLKVPPGTGGGVRLRLAGRGIRPERGAAGDLYAVVRINPIKAPSQRQRDLLEELADTLDGDPREKLT